VALNPDYGTWDDFDAFVQRAHDYELKVIIDWVANHTAFDATWTRDSIGMGYYLLDEAGQLQPPTGTDWVDVAQLDWDNGESNGLYDAMEEAMVYWVEDHGVDGFRCDVAGKVPTPFWNRVRKTLEGVNPEVFMLAEAEEPEHHERAFDASYAWEFHHLTNEIAKGEKSADDVRAYMAKEYDRFPASAYRLNFGEFGARAQQLVEEGDMLYFERAAEGTSVRVVVNLSDAPVEFTPEGLEGYRATYSRKSIEKTTWDPWSFEVFVKQGA
jgi:glycosidase